MAKVSKPTSWHNILYSKITLGVLALLLIIFSYNLVGLVIKSRQTAENRALAQKEKEALTARQEDLSKNIASLNTDEGVEQALRDKYGVVKEGEKVVVIIDPPQVEASVAAAPTGNFFTRLWHKLFPKS